MSLKLKVAANPPLQNAGSGNAFPLKHPGPGGHGTIRFQNLYIGVHEPTGPISTFTDIASLKPAPMPEKGPGDLKRKWRIWARPPTCDRWSSLNV